MLAISSVKEGPIEVVLQAVVGIASAMDATVSCQGDEEQRSLAVQQGHVLQYMKQKLPTNSELAQASQCCICCTFHA